MKINHAAKAALYGSVAILLLGPEGAFAQQADPGSDSVVEQNREIIVTANKREQSINSVGMSISALSGDILQEKNLTTLEDITSIVPGLSFARSATNTPILTLRGVGFNEETLGVYPAVSAYLDQAPLPFPVMASQTAFDLERVEVLKGPQGTLFGQNSTGGAINYIAAKPTGDFELGGNLGLGNFSSVEGNAYVSGPLSQTLRGRLAVNGKSSDGWQRNFRTGEKNGAQRYIAVRAILEWEPSDRLRASLNLNGWRDKSDPIAQQLIAVSPNNPIYASDALKGAVFVPESNRLADWSIKPSADKKMYQAIGRIDYDIFPDITITSMTSYIEYRQDQKTDSDGSVIRSIDTLSDLGKVTSFNQELRISNSQSSSMRWVVGANYEHSKAKERLNFSFFDGSANNPVNLFLNEVVVESDQNIENYAAFANVEKDLGPLTLLAGLRYTKAQNDARTCNLDPGDGSYNARFNQLGLALGTVPFDPIGPGDCTALNYNNVPGFAYQKRLSEDNVSWKVGANYKISDGSMLYANVSRGYKSGSFPILAASSFIQYEPVTQESVTAYEIGVKSDIFGRLLHVNAAGFYYDYKDKQLRGKIVDPLYGLLNALVNVPKSRIYGFDADVTARPINGLTLAGRVTYLNSKIQEYEGSNAVRIFNNFAGDPLPFAPKWSYGADIDYHADVGTVSPFVGASVNGRSTSDAQPGGYRMTLPVRQFARSSVEYLYHMPAYATVDARAGIEAGDASWKITAWGRNIFNKLYWSNVTSGSETVSRFVGMPATYGVTVSFRTR